MFIDEKLVGIIEAYREDEGNRLTQVEEQSLDYAQSQLKYVNIGPLPFVYESTGELNRFTDCRDKKPRSRQVFSFHKPETFQEWLKKVDTLRNTFENNPVLPTLEEQQGVVEEIESRLSVCDKLEVSIARSLAQSEALRQSILKHAFEEKLVQQELSEMVELPKNEKQMDLFE